MTIQNIIPRSRYPLAQITYGQTEIDAVVEALKAGQTTCGPRVREFEQSFASYVGRKHAIMVNSGSSADLLVAFGLGPARPDEEILVPAVTWPTQVWSCLVAGYKVRLVDVSPQTLQFDMTDLVQKVNRHTRAIFPVHVLGNVGDMSALVNMAQPEGIDIIEDCCEALGSTWRGVHVGNFGRAAAFSFFFSHLITTMEGGMVITDEDAANRTYRLQRSHGWEPQPDRHFSFPTWGFNLRPTELQGAFGNVQMTKIDDFRQARSINASRLFQITSDTYPEFFSPIRVHSDCDPAWHGLPIMLSIDAPFTKNELCRYLDMHGIETRPIIAGNIARQGAVEHDTRIIGSELFGADLIHNNGFYIGLSSVKDVTGVTYVSSVLNDFLKTY